MVRPFRRGRFGEGPEPEAVRFVGGPWDGDAGRYYGLVHHPEMATPGGRCVLERVDHERGEVMYVFRHAPAG